MASAKEEILGRIRASLSDHPNPPAPARAYRRVSDTPADQVREMLVDRLVDYKATVYQTDQSGLAGQIAQLLSEASSVVVPQGLPESWLDDVGSGVQVRRDSGSTEVEGAVSDTELDETSAVLTSSTVSCAETGTIFLNSRPDEGRRAITLVPDHHICVVPAASIVELVPEAMAQVTPERPITMISGPSATSDIELQRVEGVHGPRRLDVIILD